MKNLHRLVTSSITCAVALFAQHAVVAQTAQTQLKSTYVRLANNANALLVENPIPGPKGRIVAINTHPGHNNNFNYFIGQELAARGYRALLMNYYGPETTMEEFFPAIAAAVKYARSIPGVEKVVFATHSGGGPELTYYQEIAEKGPAACQEPNRLYPCKGDGLTGLPKVDGILLLDINIGAPHRSMTIDPAVNNSNPRQRNPSLDLWATQNGYDAKTNTAEYSDAFLKRFLTAQHNRIEQVVDEAQSRMRAVEAGKGMFKDDEPFFIAGMAENSVGARINLADGRLLSRTHAPHLHLKADGTRPVEIVHSTRKPVGMTADRDTFEETGQEVTVRHFLSFQAVRTTADYAFTEDSMQGIDWRSSGNSAPGNVENISVPTLVMAATCAIHLVPLETVYDHSAAKDKEFVAVEGANHGFSPCRPEFGDTRKRTFDYVDAWLSKPGRF
jgi:hypothetical protein